MTPQQKSLIRSSWRAVEPIADEAAAMFYDRLFELDPNLRLLFRHTDMSSQRTKLLTALGAVVAGLDRLDRVVPALEELGRRHAGYGVEDRHYETVGSALLWTLEQGLGEVWNADLDDAWSTAYATVSSVMRDAMREAEAAPAAA